MTLANYTAEVKGNLLLELSAEAEELHLKPSAKVQVQVAYEAEEEPRAKANEGMLAALRRVAEIQKDMRETDGSQTDRMLREGRAGAMYGSECSRAKSSTE